MKNWRKKITSVLLTLVMTAVLIPMFFATPAYAATTRCGISANWQVHTSTSSLPTSGYYYFDRNWNWTYGNNTNLKVNGTLYLDLNGKTLTLKGTSTYAAIDIYNGSKLYLYDSVGTGKIVMQSDAKFVQAVYVSGTNSLFQMNGGTISGFTKATSGGAVRVVSGGKFEMKGGTLSSCTASTGGGAVSVENASTFDMSGGTIDNCQATGTVSNTGLGGAVSIASGATFNMTGGTIQNCTSSRYGGGIDSYGTFNMSGGSINKCTSGQTGGGIYIEAGTVNIFGSAKITNCYSATYGGGIGTYKNATLNISGGEISGNSNKSGHPIYVYGSGAKAYITGGIVSGEIYPYSSGAAYASGYCTLSNFRGTNNGTKTAITFDKQGGTGGTNSVDPATWNTAMPLATMPTRMGYTFAGYWDAVSGGTQYYNANGTSTRNWNKIVAATTLYAQWTENTATLAYNANGRGEAPGNVTMKTSAATNAAAAITGVTGYTFNVWNTKADGTGTAYAAGAVVKAANVDPVATTLYAQWTPNTYTIAYNANGGENTPASITATYDANVTLADAPTRTGYTFKEWNTVQGGTGTAYAAGASVKNLAASGTVTLYAQWTANQYTVTLNNGKGSGDTTATATYDAYLPAVTVPTWEKHVFEGYYTEENGKGDRYIGKDGNGVKAWDKASDTTLYAFWKDSARVESMDLLLDGDICMRYHVAVNDPELQQSGAMTVSIGSKKPSETTIPYSDAPKDTTGAILFPFNVSSIQMAEPVKVEFKDGSGNVIAADAKSVEDYYNLVEKSSATGDQKEMVRTLVNYGYYAQQALSKTRGWTIGSDYKASTLHGDLSSTSNDLKAYKPVISGTGTNVKDIQLSLLLDSKTTLCVYVQTVDKAAPAITVDGASVIPEDNGNGWWLVKIPDIDALNLSTMHTVTANGYTVYLSALSYASVIGDSATIDAMRALLDYYQATLTANGKKMLTSATVEQSEYDYTGKAVTPVVKAYAGSNEVTGCTVKWNGNLTDAGTYTGLVTGDGYVGGVTVTVKINPVKVTAPAAETTEFTYDGTEKTVLTADEDTPYTVTGITVATDVGSYTATVSLNNTEDAANYCWEDGSTEDIVIEWSIVIVKTKVEIPAIPEATSFTYNGQAQTLEIAASDYYTVTGNTATNAGGHTATVTLKENCYWSDDSTDPIQISWTITKKEIAVPAWTVNKLTYTGEEQTGVTVEENAAYTLTDNTGTNAGSYTATLALTDPTNTCWNDDKTSNAKTIVWSIARKKIGIPQAVTGLVYDGSEQTGVEDGEGYTLSGTTKATNAGSYTATATLTDTANTCWSDNSTEAKTIEWSIAKADPEVADPVTVTYHPNGGSTEFSGSMNVNGMFSYDPDSNTTTFTSNDTQNYNTVSVEAKVNVDKTVSTVNVPLSGN